MSRYVKKNNGIEFVSLRGGLDVVADELFRLLVRDFTPVMQQIKAKYMEPAATASWAGSGLHSRSGELHGAVATFAGKVSAGVGVMTVKGKDLVLPKAYTQTFGRKKFSNQRGRNRKTGKLRRRSPWGDIPPRPFIPETLPPSVTAEIKSMIVEFLNDRLGRTR